MVYTGLSAAGHGSFRAVGLAVVPAQGGAPGQITSGNDDANAWSPDGRWIAFTRYENQKQNLYTPSTLTAVPCRNCERRRGGLRGRQTRAGS